MRTKATAGKRVAVKGIGWKRSMSIAADTYAQVSKAILSSLTAEPMRFTELVRLVRKRLPTFEGSVAWYTITVARELEARGRILRRERPVLYSRPGRSRAAGLARRGKGPVRPPVPAAGAGRRRS